MNLSKRLEAVATLVDVGAKVIDVGCDHAYLDIYLTLNNDNKCIATDINENALNMAKTNIKKYKLGKKIKTILTDGLKDIDVEKVKLDVQKIYDYYKDSVGINPHSLMPNYLKKTEAEEKFGGIND